MRTVWIKWVNDGVGEWIAQGITQNWETVNTWQKKSHKVGYAIAVTEVSTEIPGQFKSNVIDANVEAHKLLKK